MTFKEKLTQISDTLELELSIASNCAEIRDHMESAANCNYRSFQIEIVRLLGNSQFTKATADNCYTLVSTAKPDRLGLIVNKVKDYLKQLGFEQIEHTSITNNNYFAVVLKVWW
jgi:hypothetical protein